MTYRVLCGWCGRDLGEREADNPPDGPSHGICPECKERLMEERREPK